MTIRQRPADHRGDHRQRSPPADRGAPAISRDSGPIPLCGRAIPQARTRRRPSGVSAPIPGSRRRPSTRTGRTPRGGLGAIASRARAAPPPRGTPRRPTAAPSTRRGDSCAWPRPARAGPAGACAACQPASAHPVARPNPRRGDRPDRADSARRSALGGVILHRSHRTPSILIEWTASLPVHAIPHRSLTSGRAGTPIPPVSAAPRHPRPASRPSSRGASSSPRFCARRPSGSSATIRSRCSARLRTSSGSASWSYSSSRPSAFLM